VLGSFGVCFGGMGTQKLLKGTQQGILRAWEWLLGGLSVPQVLVGPLFAHKRVVVRLSAGLLGA
jgi:hypothetical protein